MMAHGSLLPLLPGESTQSSVVQKNLFPGFDLSDRSDIPVFGNLSLVILPQNMFNRREGRENVLFILFFNTYSNVQT